MDGMWSLLQTRTERPFIVKMAVPCPDILDQDTSLRRA